VRRDTAESRYGSVGVARTGTESAGSKLLAYTEDVTAFVDQVGATLPTGIEE